MVVRRHSSTLAAPLARLVFAIGLLLLAFGDGPVAHAQSTATRPVIVKRVPTAWTVQATGGIGVDRDGLIYVATSGQIYRFGPGASDVTTIAGQSQSLPTVRGMFVTPAGLVLWTGGNHTVNRVTPAGTATVVAGANFQSGHVDGPAAIARFNNPAGIVADAAGNLYVADSNNHVIRRIALDGTVSTLAGRAGQAASLDGTGDTARFNFPQRLAIDAAGNLYVAEQSRYSIRRITPAGVVTTLAGNSAQSGSADGVGAAARFNSIAGLAVDASDAVWVFDAGRTLRRVTADGTVTTVAGAPNQSSEDRDGAGTSVRFTSPQAITAAPDGTLLLGDSWYVRRATPDGISVAPVIATQPVSISAALGGSVTLAVEAYGTPAPTYSWRKNGSIVTGGVGSSLTLDNLASVDAGDYTVVVTNNQGSVTSAVATLTLVPAPVNDDFSARTTLTGAPVSVVTGFVGATREASEPAHNGAGANGGGSLWWSWTAPATGFVTIDTTFPNWVAKIYTGNAVDALAPVDPAGAYSGSNSPSRFTFPAVAGTTYQIALERAVGATENEARFTLAYAFTVLPFVGDSSSVHANGSDDGTGAAARFSGANGIVRDSSGNYFVADSFNHTIRKITPAGVVTTFAGTAGQSGTAVGTGAAARFNHPQGLAIDASNNLYVADSQNHAIRKITPTGVVTNFAGLPGTSGMTNASGTSARFNFPRSIAVDASGNVYVADTNNFVIRRITSAGAVTTFAGTAGTADSVDGTGTAAKFYVPQGIALRGTTLYVGEGTTAARLRLVNTTNAVVTTLNYSPHAGVSPIGMAVDATGHVYFTSGYDIQRISPQGVSTRVAGSGFSSNYVDGDAYQSRFQSSFGVLIEPDGSLLFTANNTVRRATITTQPAAPVIFTQPASRSVAVGANVTLTVAAFGAPNVNFQWLKDGQPVAGGEDGTLTFSSATVADSGSYTVTASNSSGSVTSDAAQLTVVAVPANDNFAGALALGGASVNATGYNFGATREAGEPVLHGLAVGRTVWWKWTAPHDGTIVADTAGSALPVTYLAAFTGANVASLTPLGATGFASGNGDAARVYVPVSAGATYHFAIDASANNNVASEGLVRLNINYAHTVVTIAGTAGQSNVIDETGPAARFSGPIAMTRDGDGNLYVAEASGRVIRKITPAGVVTTLAGTAFTSGTADGTGASARFMSPAGMTIDPDGNLYVTDSSAHTVRRVTPAGVVTTLAGLAAADGGGSGSTDGTGSSARFNSPRGITYGSDGALYVADLGNRVIRRVTLAGEVATFAGTLGQSGTNDGTGSGARFSSPLAITSAPDGNLYIGDSVTVRRLTVPGAVVATVAGAFGTQTRIDGFGTDARFGSISSIGADAAGNIYIAESTFRLLRKLSPNGHVATVAGSGSTGANSGSGPAASFSNPQGLAVAPDGTVFFADQSQHIIRRAAPSYLPQAPLITGTPSSQTVLAGESVTLTVDVSAAPTAQAVWRRNGNIVANATGYSLVLANAQPGDSGDYQVEFTNASGTATTSVFTLTVLPAAANDNFADRAPLTGAVVSVVANNFLATAESGEPAHFEGGAGRSVWWTWTAPHDGPVILNTYASEIAALLSVYTGNAVNALTRVADGQNVVRFHARAGTAYQIAADGRAGAMGGFTLSLAYAPGARTLATPPAIPRQFARAADGTVYFTDAGRTVRRLEANGDTTIIAGAANQSGNTDGVGAAARFVSPEGLVAAADGTLYVTDNHTVRRIAPDGTVTTIAGVAGTTGTANGVGAEARFNIPMGLALDAAGEFLYIADYGSHTIRRLELATNTVTTFAGSPGLAASSSVHSGTGASARFNTPIALTFGPDGNLYVADQGSYTIRKVTPGAVVTTVAGTPMSFGTVDGALGTGRLHSVSSIGFDPAGHLVITDFHALRLVSLNGTIVTATGAMMESGNRDGAGDLARFISPRGLAIAPDGTGWFASNNRIVRLEAPGAAFAPVITTQPSAASGFVGGSLSLSVAAVGTPANFTYQWFRDNAPVSGATNATLTLTNLQLADAGTYRVEVSNPAGTASSSNAVVAVASRPANDSFANAIVLTGAAPGSTVNNAGATRQAGEPQHANNPGGASLWWKWIAPASGAVIADAAGSSIDPIIAVYSGDSLTNLVEQGSASPTPPMQYAPAPRPPAVMFTAVEGTTYWIAMDGDFGATGDLVLHLSFTYNFTTLAGLAGSSGNVNGTGTAARFNRLNATVPDAQGNIYVADLNNHAIRKVTPAGVVTTVAGPTGTTGVSGYVNSTTASSVRFNSPAGIVLAADGFLYVADANNHAIRKVNPNNGTTTTFAGPTSAASGVADGNTTAARFNNPAAIVLDNAGNFIVADATNHAIRRITPAGAVSTVAGLKGTSGAVDGNGTNARFNTPEGVAVDATGNIYVADFRNHSVRKIAPNGDVTTVAGQLDANIAGYRDGSIAQSTLAGPNGVTALADGSVLIADYYNSALRIITTDGYVLTLAGGNGAGHADGTGLGIKFNQPATISVDNQGRIYIADQSNHVIRRGIITSAPSAPDISKQPQGTRVIAGTTVTMTAGALGNPFPTYQWRKNGVDINGATSGTLTLANAQPSDSGSYTLVATNIHGTATTEAAVIEILPLAANDSFATRARLVGDAIGVSAYNYLATAQPGEPAHGGGAGAPAANSVWFTWTAPTTGDVTIDTIGALFDTRLSVYRGDTLATLTPWISSTAEPGKKFAKVRLAVNAGDVFQIAVDGVDGAQGDFRLTIDYSWNFGLYAGGLNTAGGGGTTLATSRFDFPAAMARDHNGNLYIADTENHTIRKITAAGVVSVFAGTAGSSGTATGTGATARFNRPYGVAVDAAGNVYVADTNNHAIRKITPAGAVSNFAGLPGTSGSNDGTGTAARFNNPVNLALDSAGNVYVTDYSNALIRKITPAGVVTTFAGTLNTFGNDPKYFNVPWGIAVDAAGNVYVGDRADIRKLTPNGLASYFAGNVNSMDGSADGLGTAAEFNYPAQISIDAAGNLYVADRLNSLIRKVSPNGEVRTIGGRPQVHGYLDGTADVAVFGYPMGLFVDAGGFMYVGDSGSYLVRLGSRQAGPRAPAIVTQPADQAVPSGGTVSFTVVASGYPTPTYQWRRNGVNIVGATSPVLTLTNVTQIGSYDVVVTNTHGTVTSRAAGLLLASAPQNDSFANALPLTGPGASGSGSPSLATAEAGEPAHAGAAAARSLWWSWMAPAHGMVVAQTVGSAQDTRLAVYTGSSLNALTLVGENDDALAGGTSRVQFTATAGTTYHFAVDVNETFATNFGGVRVGVDYAYVSSTFAGSAGNAGTVNGTGAAARFTNPSGIARDSFGNLYVSEAEQHVIRKVTPEGVVSVFAGAPGQFGAVNGNGAAARFNLPYGLAVDANDNVFVADYGNRVIRRITPNGDVTTFAGAFGQGGATDGAAGTARFNLVFGLAFDANGVLYVTDLGNHNVRKISAGNVTTLAGSTSGVTGALDGTTTAARFNQPRGLAVDSQGSVYVADFGNHTVRKITAAGVVTTLAGFAGSIGAADGVGSNARFAGPFAVAIDAQERLYVTDANHRVRVVSPVDGLVTTAAGSTEGAAEGIALAAQFDVPFAIIAAPNGVLYIADYDNHTVRALTPSSQVAVAQSIGFAPLLDRAYTPNPITLNATTTSGLPVIFELVEGNASLDGNQLTLLGTGVITIRATQPGNATTLPATPVERSFTVTPNFLSWQLERFTPEELANATLTGPNADYDRDGVSNLVEYALGRDPKVAGAAPFAEVAASAGEWTFVYSRPADRTDVSYTVEISTNLTTWTTANVTHERTATGATETWRARAPLSTGANLFFRLRVER